MYTYSYLQNIKSHSADNLHLYTCVADIYKAINHAKKPIVMCKFSACLARETLQPSISLITSVVSQINSNQ